MFMTRCKYFDDNGIPINGGCTNSSCNFLHPTHLRWGEARKPTRAYSPSRGIRGRGRGRGEPPARKRARPLALVGTASNRTDQPRVPAFDPSTWSSGSNMPPAETDAGINSWGYPDTGANAKLSSDEGGGWGTSLTPADGGFGITVPTWGDGDAAAQSSGWGGGGADAGGWGVVTENGWGGNGQVAAPGWGTVGDQEPQASPAWGRPAVASGRDVLDQKSRVSPVAEAYPAAGLSGQREGSRVSSGQGSVWGADQDSRISPPASDTLLDPSTISRSSKEISVSSSPAPVESADDVRETGLRIQTTSLEVDAGLPTSAPESALPLRPLSQTEIYSRAIRKYYCAVSLKLELDNIQFQSERWKRTMNSASYAHGTPMQRIRLEEERAKLAQEMTNLTRDLKNATNALVDLPLLSTTWNSIPPEIDDQEVMKHTSLLRNWISELQDFHLLALPFPTVNTKEEQEDQEPLLEWNQLILSVEELETFADQMDELMGNFYTSKYTNLMDEGVTAKIQEYHKDATDLQKTVEWGEVKTSADRIGKKVEAEAIRLAELYTQVHNNDLELQELQKEKEKLVKMSNQIEEYFQQLEQSEQEDLKKIQILTEKVQNLHLHPLSSTLQSFSVDSLLPAIQKLVENHLQGDVISIVENLHAACIQNHDLAIKELYKNVQPIVDLTTKVYKHAQLEVALSNHF